ncbi:membrane protein [Streptococcus pyogenes]|nr:membrane protein [Streptococcus pyogenes]VHA86035.1 membrane protein [Streptococcus pyogenes]VHD21796.1 membrane protein [Streptococcus pyogenes]VHD54703.1 membrane protein [Streptococcus pyogenes]
MRKYLQVIGASIAFAGAALCIDHMHDGVITRIEMIKSLK